MNLLPAGATCALAFPEYETQDDVVECAESEAGSDTDTDATCIEFDLDYDELRVGTCVQVYWSGDNKWYTGEITALDESESGKQFEVFYESDGEKWWHDYAEFKCRFAN